MRLAKRAIRLQILFWRSLADRGILLISVRMRAPSAPKMSFGSRATQAKPEALVILFRANP